MKMYKLWCHICAFIKCIVFRCLYGKRFTIGKHVTWRHRFNVLLDKKAYIIIDDDCFFNNDCSLNAIDYIKIGAGTVFGENVKIYDHNHRFKDVNRSIKSQGYTIGGVTIGRHCWLGSNVVVLKGSVIGDNCVIGAGVVVNGCIPSGTIIRQRKYETEHLRF